MDNNNSIEITLSKNSETGTPLTGELMTGVLIGGVAGLLLGAIATLLARLFFGLAGQLIRKLVRREDVRKAFDPRWLLQ